jgi:plastocyanin
MKDADSTSSKQNTIEIKDFAFNPQTITVKSGERVTWINRDEEPHTVVSVGKKFKKSSALDTDQTFTITAGAPGTYTYFCSVHPKTTGTIVARSRKRLMPFVAAPVGYGFFASHSSPLI